MNMRVKLSSLILVCLLFVCQGFVNVKGQQKQLGEIVATVPGILKSEEDFLGPYFGFNISVKNQEGKSFWMDYEGLGRFVLKNMKPGIYELHLYDDGRNEKKLSSKRAKFEVVAGKKVELEIAYAWLVCDKKSGFVTPVGISHTPEAELYKGLSEPAYETWKLPKGRNLMLSYCQKRVRNKKSEYKPVRLSYRNFDVFGQKAIFDPKKQTITIYKPKKNRLSRLMKEQEGITKKRSRLIISLRKLKTTQTYK